MAVGQRFNDPATQAAMQAQAGTPEAETPDVTQDPAPEADLESPSVETQDPVTNPETETVETADLTMETTPEKATEITEDALKAAGFSIDDVVKQLQENGGKVPDSLKEKLGEKFSAEAIEAGVQKLDKAVDKTKAMNNYIYESLASGDAKAGADNFKKLSEWCQKHMKPEEITTINYLLKSSDKTVVRQGLTQAVAAWKPGKTYDAGRCNTHEQSQHHSGICAVGPGRVP